MQCIRHFFAAMVLVLMAGSCGMEGPEFLGLPLETRFAFTNFSLDFYATLSMRANGDEAGVYEQTPLLAPGATFRGEFFEFTGNGCPDAIDVRVFLYARVNDDLPVGLDEGEDVSPTPIVAGELLNVPACRVQALETFTIVNWEAAEGVALVKLAQGTAVEDDVVASGLVDGIDGTWRVEGVEDGLGGQAPPGIADNETLTGFVTLADGSGVEGVGVLLRTRFRVRLNDDDETNDPDAGFGDPIAVASTDTDGRFSFDRPPGAYEVEFFADDLVFRPVSVIVESPIEVIRIVAEEL